MKINYTFLGSFPLISAFSFSQEETCLQQQSDISSVSYWYQLEPCASFPDLPSKNDLEVI